MQIALRSRRRRVVGGGGGGGGPSFGPYSDLVLADSPTFLLAGQETEGTEIVDLTGHGFDGPVAGSYTLAQPGLITEEGAKSILLTDGYIDIPPIDLVGLFALELWVKPNTGGNVTVLAQDHTPYDGGELFELKFWPNWTQFTYQAGGYSTANPGGCAAGAVHHVVWNGQGATGTGQLYVNNVKYFDAGVLGGQITRALAGFTALRIGDNHFGGSPLVGSVSHVAGWEAGNLTVDQIAAHYAQGTA